MAQYLILIYESESGWANATPEQFKAAMDAHNAFPHQVEAAGGKMLGGNALQPTGTATSDPRRRRHRRPVHRDQGGARRLLRDRGARPRPRARARQARARRRSAASRSGRSWASRSDPWLDERRHVAAAVADAHRREWAYVLAATVRVTRDLDPAEECVQDAYASALRAWARDGVPGDPGAWLTTVARRRALDRAPPRAARCARKLPLLRRAARRRSASDDDGSRHDAIPDDRLRLIFTCCHPALARRGAGRADAAPGVRRGDAGHRPGVPGPGADDGRPHHAGQEEDRRRPASRTGVPRGGRAARAARRGAHRHPPALHDRPHRAVRRRPGARRPDRAGARPRPDAAPRCCPTSARSAGCSRCCSCTDARRATRTDAGGAPACGSTSRTASRGTAARSPRPTA